MKILSAEQIRELEAYTIKNEPVSSIDLMERAASAFVEAITERIKPTGKICVYCGMGNNGGDGLAVARMLLQQGYASVSVYVILHSTKHSDDFKRNEERLKTKLNYIKTENEIPAFNQSDIIIDALFGSGLSRPVEGLAACVINRINQSAATVYSIDVPSGLFCDKPNATDDSIVESTITYTFHAPKLSFMFAANGKYVPQFQVLDIGLNQAKAESFESSYHYTDAQSVRSFFRKRERFSHKGTYGHALIGAGSFGKMGAAVLAVKAALRSGAGLVSANVPGCGYEIMQVSSPEAMVELDVNRDHLSVVPGLEPYKAIGIGPGIGTGNETVNYLETLLEIAKRPIVLDADALNIMSSRKNLLSHIPANSILTPHPGEFKRLVGEWKDDADKLQKQIKFSKTYKVVLVLKGANTSISSLNGQLFFNSTGNAGMAKGGSGDVLTGIITSILAQGYEPLQAAILGVYVHGLSGDYAKAELGETAIKATDLVYYLPQAFKSLELAS